jgi:polysaccharide biosynthesis transport protein
MVMQSDMGGMEPTEFPMSEDTETLAASPQKGLNLRPFLRTARRKALLIGGVAGVVTAGMWHLTAKAPPIYEGNFRVLVEPVTSEAKLAEPSTLTRTGDTSKNQMDYPTQLEILRSPGMLDSIVKLVRTRYKNFGVNSLRKGLTVARIGEGRLEGTKILNISYQGLDPDVVEFVLLKTSEKYLKYSLEERKTSIGQGVKFIQEQVPALQKRVDTYQAQLQQLQQQYELIDPTLRAGELYTQIRQFESEQVTTSKELQELRTLSATLQQQLQLTPSEARVAAELSENPYRSNLLAQLKQIESQIAVQSATFRPDSPEIQLLLDQRENVLSLLEQETQQIPGVNLSGVRDNPNVFAVPTSLRQGQIQQLVETANQIQLLEVRLETLAQVRSAFEREASQFPEVTRQYTDIQQKLDLTKQTLNQLLAQQEKLRVEAAQNNVPWELISLPQIPRDSETGEAVPLPADSSKMLLVGIAGGLMLGLGVAIALEKWRDIFYTMDDIQDGVQPPILGEIPLQETLAIPLNSLDVSEISLELSEPALDPHFLDAFDSLYANIRFLYANTPIRALTICSAEVGDGKSAIALQLARTVANMGQRVLLVDANLRQPQLHERVGVPNRKGLSELLTDKLVPNALVEPSPFADNLFILTAGHPSAKSIKLLGSAQMQHIAEEFQATFDLVIYDTPALGNIMDAIFLAAQTDGILMVVGVQKTRQSNTLKTMEQLNAFRLPCLGIVASYPQTRSSSEIPSEFSDLTPEPELGEDTPWEASESQPQEGSRVLGIFHKGNR